VGTGGRTNNLAYAEATPRHRLLAFAIGTAVVLIALTAAPVSGVRSSATVAFLPAVGAVALFAQLLTALLLYNQYRASRYSPIFFLSLAYASSGILLVPYLLTFPRIFASGGLLGAGPQTAAWLYFAWHFQFVALVLVYVYFERYATLKLFTPERERVAITNVAWAVGVATVAIVVVTTRYHEYLPQIVNGSHATALSSQLLVPGLLGLYGLGLLVLAMETRLRGVAQLCIGMVLIASFFEVLIGNVVASEKFTTGWYIAWAEWIIAATVFLCVLLYHVYQLMLELAASNRVLLKQAMGDDLTGLLNRRGFNAHLEEQWHRCRRKKEPLCLLIIDVDEFKKFNDRFGHPAGDAALVSVADVLRSHIRNMSDSASRLGGEEFGVILGETDEPGGLAVSERIRRGVERLQIPQAPGSGHPYITISIGLAAVEDEFGVSAADLTMLADQALYAAKAAGRNCTRTSADNDIALRRHRLRAANRPNRLGTG